MRTDVRPDHSPVRSMERSSVHDCSLLPSVCRTPGVGNTRASGLDFSRPGSRLDADEGIEAVFSKSLLDGVGWKLTLSALFSGVDFLAHSVSEIFLAWWCRAFVDCCSAAV